MSAIRHPCLIMGQCPSNFEGRNNSARFIVDKEEKPTSVILDRDSGEAIISLLEDREDIQIARQRSRKWRTGEGWTPWEQFEEELDADGL